MKTDRPKWGGSLGSSASQDGGIPAGQNHMILTGGGNSTA